jgi:hypothetical protein
MDLAGMRNPFEQPGLIVICTTIGLIGLAYLVKHVTPAASNHLGRVLINQA